MISFACPACGRDLSVPDKMAGKPGRCPACKELVRVPGDVGQCDVRVPRPSPVSSAFAPLAGPALPSWMNAAEGIQRPPPHPVPKPGTREQPTAPPPNQTESSNERPARPLSKKLLLWALGGPTILLIIGLVVWYVQTVRDHGKKDQVKESRIAEKQERTTKTVPKD